MTNKKAVKLIKKILDEDSKTAGVFISLLCYNFIQKHECSEEQFFESLKNSINILKDSDKE